MNIIACGACGGTIEPLIGAAVLSSVCWIGWLKVASRPLKARFNRKMKSSHCEPSKGDNK